MRNGAGFRARCPQRAVVARLENAGGADQRLSNDVITSPRSRRVEDNAPYHGTWRWKVANRRWPARSSAGSVAKASFLFCPPPVSQYNPLIFNIKQGTQNDPEQHFLACHKFMKTRTRIVLTLLIIMIAYGAVTLWGLIESPVSGTLTAQQLNDAG